MPPRQIIHIDNRIYCQSESMFRGAVDELVKRLRVLMGDVMGQMNFITPKDTVNNKAENMKALRLCLATLRQHITLQINGIDKENDHEFLLHMALSELDQLFDEARVR